MTLQGGPFRTTPYRAHTLRSVGGSKVGNYSMNCRRKLRNSSAPGPQKGLTHAYRAPGSAGFPKVLRGEGEGAAVEGSFQHLEVYICQEVQLPLLPHVALHFS